MDWKSQFKVHGLSFRDSCIVLLLIAVNLLVLIFFQNSFWRMEPEAGSKASRAHCANGQRVIYRIMREVSGGPEFELPPEWTVADLIREAVAKDRQASSPIPEKYYSCRNVSIKRSFLRLRSKPVEVVRPYLVFPAPASVVFDESLQPPVPILMYPPGAHGKLGSNVLYSDGTVKSMTAEEAEKLVAEQSPVPLEIGFESKPAEGP